MEYKDYAFWIAIYGAIISTGLALIRIIEILRDRVIIKVIGGIGEELCQPQGRRVFYTIELVNHGRRPITIRQIGIRLKSTGIIEFHWPDRTESSRLPITLNENEAASYKVIWGVKADIRDFNGNIKSFVAESTTGKIYRQRNKIKLGKKKKKQLTPQIISISRRR